MGRRPPGLLQVVLELARPARVAELAKRLRLDLPDPLAGHVEVAADLLESPRPPILQAEAKLEHPPLPRSERIEDSLDLLLEQLVTGGVRRRDRRQVGDEVAQVAVLLLANRRLEADWLLGDLHDLADLLRADGLRTGGLALVDLLLGRLAGRDPLALVLGADFLAQLAHDLVATHAPRDFLDGRLAPQLLEQGTLHPDQAVDGLHHVDRDADGAGLVGDGPRDRLPDPPGGVGAEFEALLVVELLDRADEADVALLDEVQEAHAAADVLLGDADHQAQVRLGQTLASVDPLLDEPPGASLEGRIERQRRVVAELAQVHRVIAVLDVRLHDHLRRLARPALQLVQLRRPGVAQRSEPITVPKQYRVLQALGMVVVEQLQDRLRLH